VEVIENPGLGARAEWLYRTLSPFQPFVVIPDLPALPSPGPSASQPARRSAPVLQSPLDGGGDHHATQHILTLLVATLVLTAGTGMTVAQVGSAAAYDEKLSGPTEPMTGILGDVPEYAVTSGVSGSPEFWVEVDERRSLGRRELGRRRRRP